MAAPSPSKARAPSGCRWRRLSATLAAPTDDLTILMHLQQQASERFHTRRQLEWQFAFSFWVLLGGLGVVLRGVPHPEDTIIALTLGL